MRLQMNIDRIRRWRLFVVYLVLAVTAFVSLVLMAYSKTLFALLRTWPTTILVVGLLLDSAARKLFTDNYDYSAALRGSGGAVLAAAVSLLLVKTIAGLSSAQMFEAFGIMGIVTTGFVYKATYQLFHRSKKFENDGGLTTRGRFR